MKTIECINSDVVVQNIASVGKVRPERGEQTTYLKLFGRSVAFSTRPFITGYEFVVRTTGGDCHLIRDDTLGGACDKRAVVLTAIHNEGVEL
jgi:hypothetical protein